MKMVMVVVDAARLEALHDDLSELGAPGCTVLPVVEGRGRTGVHAGDRVHPGGLAMVLIVAEDVQATRIFDGLVKRRDEAGDVVTRLYLLPIERQA